MEKIKKQIVPLVALLLFIQAQPAYSCFLGIFCASTPDKGLKYESSIHFNHGESRKLAHSSKKKLNKIGRELVSIKRRLDSKDIKINILIEGHTDNSTPNICKKIKNRRSKRKCSRKVNEVISYNRAVSTANYLKNNFDLRLKGMDVIGVGYHEPKIKNKHSKKGTWANRRVRIVITKVKEIDVTL